MRRWWCFLLALAMSLGAALANAAEYKIGAYYFPGWKSNLLGSAYKEPWEKIKPYPEREPLLGWYAEDDPGVMEQQLAWMKEHGLDYVVYDWLWTSDNKPLLAHGVNAYLTAKERHGVDFSILWANHTNYNFSRSQFKALFNFWAQRYFFRPDYLKVDGKPVVFIFSAEVINRNAAHIGMSTAELLEMANEAARSAGLPGVHVIGSVGANSGGGGFDYSARSGYGGFSVYNYYSAPILRFAGDRLFPHSFPELGMVYQDHWNWMADKSSGLFVVPMTSGWDKRPWGGSTDPGRDNNRPTIKEFRAHLESAKSFMDKYPDKTQRMGVICCWNEFGEGSYIEPTKKDGFEFLKQVRDVFSGGKK